jgi:hypothetical protein
MTETIQVKLTRTNFHTRWPCTVCGHLTEKVTVLAESDGSDDQDVIRVCEVCLEANDIDNRLAERARALEDEAAFVRGLIGRLQLPTFAEWQAAEYGEWPEPNAGAEHAPDFSWLSDHDLCLLLEARSCADMALDPGVREAGEREYNLITAELKRRGVSPFVFRKWLDAQHEDVAF